jgi:predicted ribosomally synthesized peptide with SipW-like signal peptide
VEVQSQSVANAASRKQLRRRRLRAVLAGGLLLGLGATITLATWNDSEFAQGTFTAGSFNMLGSTDGTTFTEHATVGAPAILNFTVNPTTLSPGDIVYAPFAVELDGPTTNDAIVTISNAATTGTVTNLTYTLIQPTTFGCAVGTTGTELVPALTPVGTVPGSPTFALTKGTPPSTPGAPVFLCFKVLAGALLTQGQTGTATWEFAAASQ